MRLSHQQLTRVLGCYPSKHRQKRPVQTSAAWHIYWLPCHLFSQNRKDILNNTQNTYMPGKIQLDHPVHVIVNLYLYKEWSARMEICKLFCRIQFVLYADLVLRNGSDGRIDSSKRSLIRGHCQCQWVYATLCRRVITSEWRRTNTALLLRKQKQTCLSSLFLSKKRGSVLSYDP